MSANFKHKTTAASPGFLATARLSCYWMLSVDVVTGTRTENLSAIHMVDYIDFIVYLVNLMRFVIILIKLLCMYVCRPMYVRTRANVIWNWQKATLLTVVHLGPHFGEGRS